MDALLQPATSIPNTLSCAVGGDYFNYMTKAQYYRVHIDCRYIVCLALVVNCNLHRSRA